MKKLLALLGLISFLFTTPVFAQWMSRSGGRFSGPVYDSSGNELTGGAAGAPTTASYLTITNNGSLSNERAISGTSNQIIVTDNGANSTAVLSLPQSIHTTGTPSFSGLTLSGLTSGSVLFASGSGIIRQDNANFFWNDANNRLGIGTASPTAQLHVVSNASTTVGQIIQGADGQTGDLQNWTDSGSVILAGVDADGAISSFKAATSNGEFQLGSASSTSMIPFFTSISEDSNTGLYIGNYRSTSQSALTGYGIGATYINTDGWTMTTGRLFNVANNSTAKFTVDFEGKVGVGQRDPGSQLGVLVATASTVGQIIKLAASATANALEIQNSTGTTLSSIDKDGRMVIGKYTGSTFADYTLDVRTPASAGVTLIKLGRNDYYGTIGLNASGFMEFTSAGAGHTISIGSSGIGIDGSANFPLEVVSAVGNTHARFGPGSSYSLSLGTQGNGYPWIGDESGNAFILRTNAADRVFITSAGLVGVNVGINTPDAQFEVDNAANARSIFVASDNGTKVFAIEDGAQTTMSGTSIIDNQTGTGKLVITGQLGGMTCALANDGATYIKVTFAPDATMKTRVAFPNECP